MPKKDPYPSEFHNTAFAPRSAKAWFLYLGLPLLLVLLWDVTSADQLVAHRYGTVQGFPLRENYWLSQVFHTRARQLGVLLGLISIVNVFWPMGWMKKTKQRERVWLASMIWVCALGISAIKATSTTSCPWSLQEFGGVAAYVWHFAAGLDGGDGRCFPSGHASTFFSFLPLFWVVRRYHVQLAWKFLAAFCLLSLLLSWVQVMRGAHFPSHILWTAWLCWAVSALASPLLSNPRSKAPA